MNKLEKVLETVVLEYVDQIARSKYSRKFNKKAVKNLFIGDEKKKLPEGEGLCLSTPRQVNLSDEIIESGFSRSP